jgi:hypothetical protein
MAWNSQQLFSFWEKPVSTKTGQDKTSPGRQKAAGTARETGGMKDNSGGSGMDDPTNLLLYPLLLI